MLHFLFQDQAEEFEAERIRLTTDVAVLRGEKEMVTAVFFHCNLAVHIVVTRFLFGFAIFASTANSFLHYFFAVRGRP